MSGFQIQTIGELLRAGHPATLSQALSAAHILGMSPAQLDIFLCDADDVEEILSQIDSRAADRFAVAVSNLRKPGKIFATTGRGREIAEALLRRTFEKFPDLALRRVQAALRKSLEGSAMRFDDSKRVGLRLTEAIKRLHAGQEATTF